MMILINLFKIPSYQFKWIPYDIAKGGFGIVYRAKWIDGYIFINGSKLAKTLFVALKSLKDVIINEI